ncbi:methionine aminopeptidase [Anaerobacillus sp. MEB173]|uniref:methionine aminopeptidase n=1 Tax=Anaerobacillus sp. MEB173 TaxID=3383345 RepID=UPI003F8FB151
MGLMNMFSDWRATNYEKKIERMREKGVCPDCNGNGYNYVMINEFAYMNVTDYDCPGCNGSGLFSDWEATQ